jgi:hypothetical protein
MSDHITTRDGERITAKQVESALVSLRVISTWCAVQRERHYEEPDVVFEQIEKLAMKTLKEISGKL